MVRPKDIFPILKKRSFGFTLIELLVVISIIMLLSTVILASTTKSRQLANDATIKESLVQLRNAYEMSYSTNASYIKMIPNDLIPDQSIIEPGNGISCTTNASVNGSYYCQIFTFNNNNGCSIAFQNEINAIPPCQDLLKKSTSFKIGISYNDATLSNKYLHNYAIYAKFSSQNKYFCIRSNGKILEIDSGSEDQCKDMNSTSYPW